MNLNRLKVRQVIAGVDWGYTNPGVIDCFAVDGDLRMVQLREHYHTRKTIDWWIERATAAVRDLDVDVFVCDPSEPGFIQQFVDAGLNAIKARNDILPGISAVAARLAPDGVGRKRLLMYRDALRERDDDLVERGLPASTVDEFTSYVWPKGISGAVQKDKPVDEHNHGLDALRYAVMYLDIDTDDHELRAPTGALADYLRGQ
jgi:phage terminase large subunit